MSLVHSQELSRIIHTLRRKDWHVFLASRDFMYTHNYDQHFTLVTGHKPLLSLLGASKAFHLRYPLEFKGGLSQFYCMHTFWYLNVHVSIQNADALSPPETMMLLGHLDQTPITAVLKRKWTRQDPNLSKAAQYTQDGCHRKHLRLIRLESWSQHTG